MTIRYALKFKKQYKKLPQKFQQQFDGRLRLFLVDPTNHKLRIHPLKGSFRGYWSMNISGDLRALYLKKGEEVIIFGLIGTHSKLYG
ncbi:type II toxin-antitoxin system RelE/ParE family toxin [Patescibacteria group bacterium]|nr:type II toxin-antitoxin system RelE/ParE family toxin [Patescibacteria group bacterium]